MNCKIGVFSKPHNKKKQYYNGMKEDLALMNNHGGLTKLVKEIIDIPTFESSERTLKFKPDDKRTH